MSESPNQAEVLIVGGGLIGLCSAHYLHEAGYRVRVLERREAVGLETSFANSGMVTPSMSDPWNAPGVHRTILKYLGRAEAPMLLRPGAIGHYLGWGLKFLRHSAPARFEPAMRANFKLSAYSLQQLKALRASLGLEYEQRIAGTMKVFRDQAGMDQALADCEKLQQFGLRYRLLDRAAALALEPVLGGNAESIVGALQFPDDETGDAQLFCQQLQRSLATRGVQFSFNDAVQRLQIEQGAIRAVHSSSGVHACSKLVVAAAGWSPKLLAGSGVRVWIKPVKGYSVTVPLEDASLMPGRSIIDNEMHAAVTPLARRLRLAGTAEFAGWNPTLDPARIKNLWNMLESVNPALAQAVDRGAARNWCGFRPMSADGNPYIGATRIKGLYLNSGHGYLGWTQSAGSGALLTQQLGGAEPEIDDQPYRVARG